MSPKFNIWAGRFLPPSDRANLYGPFYSHHWAVYSDGVQNGHPFISQGRDNGVAYWGDFGKVKVSAGAFDGLSATKSNDNIISAARVQVDFWDAEGGYYLNGTYYGDKDLLAVGAAVQAQSDDEATNTATTLDFLLEKKLGDGGVISVESEYANYDGLGGYNADYASSEGGYVLGSYLFPKRVGMGQVRGPRQVRRGQLQQVRRPGRLRPENQRVRLELRDQAVQRARDVLLQEHGLQRGENRRQAGRRRAADPDVRSQPSLSSVTVTVHSQRSTSGAESRELIADS